MHRITSRSLLIVSSALALAGALRADEKPEFPKWEDVAKGFEKVASAPDGQSLYGIWTREKDGQMLAELPAGYQGQKHFIALTSPTGEIFAGLQSGDFYGYWKRFDKRMAFILPELVNRSDKDQQVREALKKHFPDRVLFDVPIVCMGPSGQPVIDMDDLLVGQARTFYGWSANGLKKQLATITEAKAFPQNVELTFEVPNGQGTLQQFHYSLSLIPDSNGYQPRVADNRVGFFTTSYQDLGTFKRDDMAVRYVNRFRLEKADPNLKISPPKEPIVFYLEHTVPVRYRRWVKAGVEAWNEAFLKIGISDAVVVQYQDEATGANMEKDPADVRYNFVRWLSNNIGTAIGPSRAHPLTGEILDADVILTDGWIRAFWYYANEFIPDTAMEGFTPETLRWLDDHPSWDPRVRLAPPDARARILEERARQRALGPVAYEALAGDGTALNQKGVTELALQRGSAAELCMASQAKAQSMRLVGLTFAIHGLVGDEGEDDADMIDGIPEWFIGPALADLVMHEVGHTLGLRHNFRGSGLYSLAEINSNEMKGKKPFAGSVMDYIPMNVNMGEGEVQGDFVMIKVGPYDEWAIEYGYGFGDPKETLKRVGEPDLAYLTDEDTSGPDPLARRYDFAKDPLEYAENRMRIAKHSRGLILDEFVGEGESWSKARRGYEITLGTQTGAIGVMANWLGGAHVHRVNKGDAEGQAPLEVVSADEQRKALRFVIENAFFDEAFGLTPELLSHMTVDKWYDAWGVTGSGDSTWPIHDRVSGVQASALTMILNPSTLRRIYDNEAFVPESEDAFTLAEMMDTVSSAIWAEVGYKPLAYKSEARAMAASSPKGATFSARKPMISSLRRALQREHLERMIELCMEEGWNDASKTISLLARQTLATLGTELEGTLGGDLDPYTQAHLADAHKRIEKVLDASYTYDSGGGGAGGGFFFLFGKDDEAGR